MIVEKYNGLYTSKEDGSVYSLGCDYYPADEPTGIEEERESKMIFHNDDGRPFDSTTFKIKKRDRSFVYFA